MALPCPRCLPIAALVALSFANSGCAVEWEREHELYCRMEETLAIRETLYFGAVDGAAWQRFDSEAIAPAFPDASTTLDTSGRRIVAIVHADDATSNAAVREIVKRFRIDFPQVSALREHTAVCASPAP